MSLIQIKDFYNEAYELVCKEDYLPNLNNEHFKNTDKVFIEFFHDKYKSSKYFPLFKEYVRIAQPKVMVELGSREGASFLAIYTSLNNTDQQLYTIDIVNDWRFVPVEIWKDSRVTKIIGNVLDEAVIKLIPDNIDFLFCDTIHNKVQLSKEWEIYGPKMNPSGSIVFIDDINLENKIEAFTNISIKSKFNQPVLHSTGFGVVFIGNENENY